MCNVEEDKSNDKICKKEWEYLIHVDYRCVSPSLREDYVNRGKIGG